MGLVKILRCKGNGNVSYDSVPNFLYYDYLIHNGNSVEIINEDIARETDRYTEIFRVWVSETSTNQIRYIDFPLFITKLWYSVGFANKKSGTGSLFKLCSGIVGFRLDSTFNFGQSSVYTGEKSGFLIQTNNDSDKDSVTQAIKKFSSMSIEYYLDNILQKSIEFKPKEAYVANNHYDIVVPSVESDLSYVWDLGSSELSSRSRYNIKINGYEFDWK